MKPENAKSNDPASDSRTVGLLSAWKENAHASLGPENGVVGVDVVNVPVSV